MYDEPPDFEDEFEDDADHGLDPEGPSEADLERFGNETETCPECGSEAYELAPLCHVCGHAFETPPSTTTPWTMIIAALAVLAMLLLFVF